MKTTVTLRQRLILSLVTMLMLLSACSKDDKPSDGGDGGGTSKSGYRIIAFTNDSKGWGYYLLPFENLMTGSITPVNYGYDVTGTFAFNGTFYHKGYYYFFADNRFNKFKVDENGQLTRVGAAVFPYFNVSYPAIQWVDDNTLAIVGAKDSHILYAIINTDNMTVSSSGTVDVPFYSGPKVYSPEDGGELTVGWAINCFKIEGNKALIGYNYDTWPYLPGLEDTNYYAVMDYPSFTNVTIKEETKFGMVDAFGSSYAQFKDDEGNLYLTTNNGGLWPSPGFTPKKEGVYRIKKGEFLPDDSYFIEIPASSFVDQISDVAWSTYYIGNNKALIMTPMNYIIVDVATKTVVKNLAKELPKLVATYGQNYALVDNNKLYLAIITESEGSNIYEYDPATDKLTKGLEIDGGVARLSELHKVEGE